MLLRLVFSIILSMLAQTLLAQQEVAYGPYSAQKLDYYPATTPGSPLMVVVHGGGWRTGDKADAKSMLIVDFFKDTMGYAVVSVNFRLSNDTAYSGYPDQLSDLACALHWVHQNGSGLLNADTSKIGMFGSSSGAHMAIQQVLYGASKTIPNCGEQPRIDAVIAIAGLYEFDEQQVPDLWVSDVIETRMWQMVVDSSNWELAQPVNFASAAVGTRFLLIHSFDDAVVDYNNTRMLYDSLLKYNQCVHLRYLEAFGHGSSSSPEVSSGYSKIKEFLTGIWEYKWECYEPVAHILDEVNPLSESQPDDTTAVQPQIETIGFELWPNPGAGSVNVRVPKAGVMLYYFTNMLGKSYCDQRQVEAGESALLDTSMLSAGVWMLTVRLNQTQFRTKLLIER